MLSRTIRPSVAGARITSSNPPPGFLLSIRARYFNSTPHQVEPAAESSDVSQLRPASGGESPPSRVTRRSIPQPPVLDTAPVTLSQSVKDLLPLLAAQPDHYMSAHIHGKPYLVTVGDTVRLPFEMPNVIPGDILRLNRLSSLGSRDYTLKGAPYVDERIFECRATVMGTDSEPMRIKEKTKRRNRKIKRVKSKHKQTILSISEITIKSVEDLEG